MSFDPFKPSKKQQERNNANEVRAGYQNTWKTQLVGAPCSDPLCECDGPRAGAGKGRRRERGGW